MYCTSQLFYAPFVVTRLLYYQIAIEMQSRSAEPFIYEILLEKRFWVMLLIDNWLADAVSMDSAAQKLGRKVFNSVILTVITCNR